MKKITLLATALLCLGVSAFAQQRPAPEQPDYQFTTVKAAPITSIKNQASSGTCWAFSAISFLESDVG